MTTTEAAPGDRRAQKREAKRAQIVAVAWELAHRDGLAGISLRDLAARVDLRQPSLYAYFASKAELYDAMFAQGNRELLDFMADLPDGDARTEAATFVRRLLEFATADIVRYQLLFQRPIPGWEPSPAAYAPAVEFYEDGQRRLAAAGVTDPADFDLFTALVSGLASQQVSNDPGGRRWVELAERAVEMFFADVDRRRPKRRGARGAAGEQGEKA